MEPRKPALAEEVIGALDRLAPLAAAAERVTVLTGAGVSAESGVPTFRDAQTGLWERYDPVMLASVEGFNRDPETVWRWYDERRQTVRKVQPNPGHYVLSEWERTWRGRGAQFRLVTQNIDDLHGRAGSVDIIELHGNIWYVRAVDAPLAEAFRLDECPLSVCPPRDERGRMLRPHVVWFGEQLDPLNVEAAFAAAANCDLMIVAGTSSMIYPAAAIPYEAKRSGAVLAEVNPNATELTRFVDFELRGPSGVVLPELWRRVRLLMN